MVDRSDGVLGPKVRKWDGACPSVMPVLYRQTPRCPVQRVGDRFVVGPAPEANDPAVSYCPTGCSAGGIRIDRPHAVTMSTASVGGGARARGSLILARAIRALMVEMIELPFRALAVTLGDGTD